MRDLRIAMHKARVIYLNAVKEHTNYINQPIQNGDVVNYLNNKRLDCFNNFTDLAWQISNFREGVGV